MTAEEQLVAALQHLTALKERPCCSGPPVGAAGVTLAGPWLACLTCWPEGLEEGDQLCWFAPDRAFSRHKTISASVRIKDGLTPLAQPSE